jgi:hypothetical protein
MKLHALMIAVALAAGSAFAQAPSTPASPSGSTAADTQSNVTGIRGADAGTKATAKVHRKKVAKKAHASRHASVRHHRHVASVRHHRQLARAEHRQMHAAAAHHTHAMGAGPAMSDLQAASRQERMDRAYADWRARNGR